jgi:hypothetical protein
VSDSDQDARKKQKILDFSVTEDAVGFSKSQDDEFEKYTHTDTGHVTFSGLLD